MAALVPGQKAPIFNLKTTDGQPIISDFSKTTWTVLSFYKATCPTCMLTIPFIEKLFKHHQKDGDIRIESVAQEEEGAAKTFMSTYGLTHPTGLDKAPYSVSNQYGLTNVPTTFLIRSDGTIEQTIIGFVKKEYEQLAEKLGKALNKAPAPLFAGITVPELKPG